VGDELPGGMFEHANRRRLIVVCCAREPTRRPLTPHPLDLVERDRIASVVVGLGGARAFVRGHALRVFQRAASVYRGGDPRGPERMTVDARLEAHSGRAALDHAVGVDAVHGLLDEHARAADRRVEEGNLAVVAEAGSVNIRI